MLTCLPSQDESDTAADSKAITPRSYNDYTGLIGFDKVKGPVRTGFKLLSTRSGPGLDI